MTAATYQMVIIGLQALVQEAPNLINSIRTTLNKEEIKPEDWDELRSQIESDTYEKLVPLSRLPADPAPETPPS